MTASSPFDHLQNRLGKRWEAIEKARKSSETTRSELTQILQGQDSDSTSVVAYGSLGRGEWTSGSDLDWTLLVDGGVDPQHPLAMQRITKAAAEAGFKPPGPTGTFADLSFSHDLVHKIGGQEDTNENTTRRLLLLLESVPLGRVEAYLRVRRQLIHRYIEDDRGLRYGTSAFVPRVLLNDVVRYWRTMAVDFAQKQRQRSMQGWALRNAKLRMSRKLLFSSGLLICLRFAVDPSAEDARRSLRKDGSNTGLLEYLERQLQLKPLDVLAQAIDLTASAATAELIFDAYDQFLGMLDDEEKRKHLDKLEPEAFSKDSLFQEVRTISHLFQDGLIELFFKSDNAMADLTMKYGVF